MIKENLIENVDLYSLSTFNGIFSYYLSFCDICTYCTTLKGKKKSPSITICSQRIIKGKKKKIYFWTSSFKSIISYNKWMHSVCISFEILLIYFFNLYKKKKSLHVPRSSLLFFLEIFYLSSLSRRISFTRYLKQWNNWNEKVEYFQMVIEVQFSNNFDSTSFFSSRLFDAIEIFFIEYVRSNFWVFVDKLFSITQSILLFTVFQQNTWCLLNLSIIKI